MLIEEVETLSSVNITFRRGRVKLTCFEKVLSKKAGELFLFLHVPCRRWRFCASPKARVRRHLPQLASLVRSQASPRFTFTRHFSPTTQPAQDRNTFHSRPRVEPLLFLLPFRNLTQILQASALTRVVLLVEPLNPKFAFRREVIQQRHKARHTVLTQKSAREICHNGVSSCTDLRDHCCHEEGSQKKSLRFATPSFNSLSPHADVYLIDSDSDSSIEQLTNRGNKLRKKARYVHEGQLAPPSGPQVYKRVRRHF